MSEEGTNNFTPRAQQVLALARKEADRFNHNFVGTEHLLLGLIKLGQGVAVNGALWLLFAALVAADGLLFHPGLAKDVESSFVGALRHFAQLLVLAVPAAATSTALYLLAVKLQRNHTNRLEPS